MEYLKKQRASADRLILRIISCYLSHILQSIISGKQRHGSINASMEHQ